MVQINCCASFAQPCYTFKIRTVETTIQMKTQAKLAAIQTSNSIRGIRRHKLDLVNGNTFNVYSHNIPYLNNHVDFIFCNYLIQCVQNMTCASFWISKHQYCVTKMFHDCNFSGCYCPSPCIGNKPQLSEFCDECCPPSSTWKKIEQTIDLRALIGFLKTGAPKKDPMVTCLRFLKCPKYRVPGR